MLFHFPHVRDATSRCSSSCCGSMFSFPACTRDATSYLEASIDDNIFISRLYARCNSIPFICMRQRMIFISRLYARCNCPRHLHQWERPDFHFPLVREMQPARRRPPPRPHRFFISRLYARCNARVPKGYQFTTFSFPACTRGATVWEKGNKTCGGTELFARTSFQPTSQPQFSLGIVDVWCRFAQAGTTEITSILSLSHKPRTV